MNDSEQKFLSQNLSLIKQYKPELLPSFSGDAKLPPDFSIVKEESGRMNIQAPHPLTNEQKFVHDDNAPDESLLGLDHIIAPHEESLLFLVGMGLGHEAKKIINRFPKCKIIILEPRQDIFNWSLKVSDLSTLLANPNVLIRVGEHIDTQELLQHEDDTMRALPFHLVSHARLQELFPCSYPPLYKKLQAHLLNFKSNLQTIKTHGPLIFRNTLDNSPQLPRSVPVRRLKNMFNGLPALCVAAGPSLTKNIDILKDKENNFFLIAVDSAAKILLAHGITPHLIVTADPIPASMTKLQDVIATHSHLPLVWTPGAFPPTIKGFQTAANFLIPSVNDLSRMLSAPQDTEESFPHQISVTHTATQVAILAGCSPLIFIGLDLALSGGKDHADGCPVAWKNLERVERFKIPAWGGGEVETISVLQNQLLAMQSIISQHPEVTFVDATEGGALVQGTLTMPLATALERYQKPPMEYEECIAEVFQNAPKPFSASICQVLQKLQRELKASMQTAQTGLKNGREAVAQWKLSRLPNKRSQALKKFRKNVLASGNAFDKLMDLLELTNALYPLRAADHHKFIYARKTFNATASEKTPEQRVLEELEQNIDYFKSWIATAKAADGMISSALKNLAAPGKK